MPCMGNMPMHHMGCMPQMPMMSKGDLVRMLNHCYATCEQMAAHIKRQCDVQQRVSQLASLSDCADICCLTAKFVLRDSKYAKDCAKLCACICDGCARECMGFPDAESQHCAQICMDCARHCMMFASM